MEKLPRVTVLMPAYNREAYIREAVESVLRQTYSDFELVAVDDGSSDGTLGVLEELARKDGRVRVIRAGRLGLVGVSNETVRHARGELLARLDADDVALPGRLEKQVAYMDSHPECVVVGGQMEIMDAEGNFRRMKTVATEHEEIDGFHLAGKGSQIMNSTAMMRAAAVREVGGYRRQFEICDDLDLWMRLAEKGRLANLPEVLVRYREHDANISRQRAGWVRRRTHGAVRAAERRRGIGRVNATEYAVRLAVRLGKMSKARGIAWWGVCRRPGYGTGWRMAAFAMMGPMWRRVCGRRVVERRDAASNAGGSIGKAGERDIASVGGGAIGNAGGRDIASVGGGATGKAGTCDSTSVACTTPLPAPLPGPMFSVIVPVFNRAELVGDTIESVLGQTFGDYEIIVADDGSTDGTVVALGKYGARVRVFSQANKGEGGARNLGMREARGEYLVFLDSDDLLLPWALETFAEVIGKHDRPALVYGAERFFDDRERGKLGEAERGAVRAEEFGCFLEGPEKMFWRSVVGNAVRADVARGAGGFCERRVNAMDIDYTLRCAAARGFVKIHEPLTLLIYKHDTMVSRNMGMNVEGVGHLIAEERAGRYPGGEGLRRARRSMVCLHGRVQSFHAARAGEAGAAWGIYRRVFWWSVGMGRWRYVVGLPVVLAGGVVRKIFGKGV